MDGVRPRAPSAVPGTLAFFDHGRYGARIRPSDRRLEDRLALESRLTHFMNRRTMGETELLQRITVNPKIFGGKPIIRGRRLAVEHVLGMLAAGDSPETVLEGYPWLEPDDIRACLVYAHRMVAHETIEPRIADTSA